MPDDTQDLEVKLVRAETPSEEFNLKAEKVDRSQNNGIITKSILSVAGDVAGSDPNLGIVTFNIQGMLQNSDPDTYPNYTSIDTSQYTVATEKEINLAEAMDIWGPTTSEFDKFHWGPREIPGMMTKLSTTENATGERGPGKYTYSIEWSYANIVI